MNKLIIIDSRLAANLNCFENSGVMIPDNGQRGVAERIALAQAGKSNSTDKTIIINAWNEWTEGMNLLPEQQYGTGCL